MTVISIQAIFILTTVTQMSKNIICVDLQKCWFQRAVRLFIDTKYILNGYFTLSFPSLKCVFIITTLSCLSFIVQSDECLGLIVRGIVEVSILT